MSLQEKIKEKQFKEAVDPVRLVQEDRRRLERSWEKANKENSKLAEIAKREQVEAEAAFQRSLNDLLNVVGARELLKELKNVWGGRVDRTPYKIADAAAMIAEFDPLQISPLPATPALELGLRYRFRDAEEARVKGKYESNSEYTDGSCWSRRELFVSTIVGFTQDDLPYVASFYGSRIYREGRYYNDWHHKKEEGKLKGNSNIYINFSGQNVIVPDDSTESGLILEEQLADIAEEAPSFRVLEAEAVERVMNDYNLPRRVRYQISPFRHRRIAARIPVVNLFLG